MFGCYWKNHNSKICNSSVVWVGTLCSDAGYVTESPKLWEYNCYKKSCLCNLAWFARDGRFAILIKLVKNLRIPTKARQIYLLLVNTSNILQCWAEKEQIEFIPGVQFEYNNLKRKRSKVLVIVQRFMRKCSELERFCLHCQGCEILGIEFNLH